MVRLCSSFARRDPRETDAKGMPRTLGTNAKRVKAVQLMYLPAG